MEPSSKTHIDDYRSQVSNTIILLDLMALLPFVIYLLSSDALLSLAISILFVGATLDAILTILGISQGYREANFYRFFFSKFGEKGGLKIVITLNLILRAVIILLFHSSLLTLLLLSFVFLAAPFWNALTMMSFHNDIVLTVPTVVSYQEHFLEIPTIEKRRLETRKQFGLMTLEQAKILLKSQGWRHPAADNTRSQGSVGSSETS